jgi:hypothetical protein
MCVCACIVQILARAFPHAVVVQHNADPAITLSPTRMNLPNDGYYDDDGHSGSSSSSSSPLMRALGVHKLIRSTEPYPIDFEWSYLLPLPPSDDECHHRRPDGFDDDDDDDDAVYSDDSYDGEWATHLYRTGTGHKPQPKIDTAAVVVPFKRAREIPQRDVSSDGEDDDDEAAADAAAPVSRPKITLSHHLTPLFAPDFGLDPTPPIEDDC